MGPESTGYEILFVQKYFRRNKMKFENFELKDLFFTIDIETGVRRISVNMKANENCIFFNNMSTALAISRIIEIRILDD